MITRPERPWAFPAGVPMIRPTFGHLCKYLINRQLSVVLALSTVVGATACAPTSPTADTDRPGTQESSGGSLVGSVRSEPQTFNRLVARDSTSSLVAELTHAPLVKVDRATDLVEPWLAERWKSMDDGRSYEFQLRQGLRFSDGSPLTSDDVVFTFDVLFDDRVASPLADSLRLKGEPLTAEALGPSTVVVRFPETYSPGVRLLASLPILPRHKLSGPIEATSPADVWDVTTDLMLISFSVS